VSRGRERIRRADLGHINNITQANIVALRVRIEAVSRPRELTTWNAATARAAGIEYSRNGNPMAEPPLDK